MLFDMHRVSHLVEMYRWLFEHFRELDKLHGVLHVNNYHTTFTEQLLVQSQILYVFLYINNIESS